LKLTAFIFAGSLAVSLLPGASNGAEGGLVLESDTEVATAGFFQLSWDAGPGDLRLVEAGDADFQAPRVVYDGTDTARLVSGKPDGDYFYRLESADGPTVLSNTVEVSVRHHSLGRAAAFFAVGAAVFAATLGLVVYGSRLD
jgi:hypothetical protein